MDESIDRGGFVGGADLARLDAAMGRAQGGAAQTVIVAGEAGIGKTRLIERWAAGARIAGWHVLAGACLQPGGSAVPYAPFVEALREWIRSVEPGRLPAMLGPGRAELARILPELGPSTNAAGDGVEFDRQGQARLFEAVLGVVERLSRMRSVALVVDDLHWADDGTRDLLGFLVRGLRAAPVVFVVSTRTGPYGRNVPERPSILA